MSHAVFPPSAAHRWMRCPGSHAACKDIKSTDSQYSVKGSFAHDIAAKCLLEDRDPTEFIGGEKTGPNGPIVFTKELAAGVQDYINVVNGLLLLGGELQIEQKVALSEDCWGTSDALVWQPKVLDVVDLKMGEGVFVPAEDNEQLLLYAIMACQDRGIDPSTLDAIHLHIVQPLYHSGEKHRTATVTPADLAAFRGEVVTAIAACKAPNAPLVAGDHCRFCPVRSNCSALRASALDAVKDLLPDLDPTIPANVPPMLESLSAEHLSTVLRNVGHARAWLKAVEQHAYSRLVAGQPVPGFKLIEKVGNRQWMNEKVAAATLQALGVDPFAPPKILSPAQAEKLSPAAKAQVASLTIRPITGLSMVPESHKKPAVEPGSALLAEFAALPDE